MQERPAAHRSRSLTMEYQTLRKKVWGMLARRAEKMVRDLTMPKCASDGSFESMQCGSFENKCWCVDENGRKRGPVKSRNKLNCSRSEGKTKGRNSWKNIVTFKKYHWHIALLLTTFMRAFQNCIKFVALLGTVWASPDAPPSPPFRFTYPWNLKRSKPFLYSRVYPQIQNKTKQKPYSNTWFLYIPITCAKGILRLFFKFAWLSFRKIYVLTASFSKNFE